MTIINLNVIPYTFSAVPPPYDTLDLTIATTDNATAGEEININCTVTKRVDGLQNLPNVTWIGQVQGDITDQSAVLSFSKLYTSHGKLYTCQGTIESLNGPYSVMENYHLIVKSKYEANQLCVATCQTFIALQFPHQLLLRPYPKGQPCMLELICH